MDISFDCGSCGKHLVVDEAGAGITIDCPGCGKPVYVPSPASQKPSDQPARVEVKSAAPKALPASTSKTASSPSHRYPAWSLPPLVTKYGALRTIATFLQYAAVPIGIVNFLVAFYMFNLEAPYVGRLAVVQAVAIMVAGVFSVVMLLGAAESIRVFIAIEENTRATRQMMEYELVSKYRPTMPSTGASTGATSSADQPAQAASRVRFGSTTS
jgi:hypothetical protein